MGFLLSGHQKPQNFPGALHAPDCVIFLRFLAFWASNAPQIQEKKKQSGAQRQSQSLSVQSQSLPVQSQSLRDQSQSLLDQSQSLPDQSQSLLAQSLRISETISPVSVPPHQSQSLLAQSLQISETISPVSGTGLIRSPSSVQSPS